MIRSIDRSSAPIAAKLCSSVLCVLLTACAAQTTVRQHADFATRRAAIQSVAVLPPDISAVLLVFKGDNQPLTAEVEKVSRDLPVSLKQELTIRGLTATSIDLAGEQADADLRLACSQAQQSFNTVIRDMYANGVVMKESEAFKYKASLGPQVSELADRLGVDALLFAQYAEFHKSEGEVASDVTKSVLIFAVTLGSVIAVSPVYGATLQAALVDGSNGEVLWADTTGRTEMHESPTAPLVSALFRQFPAK
jgi:hypothetical protein